MKVLKNYNKRNDTYGPTGPQVSVNLNNVYVLFRVNVSRRKGERK